MKQIKLMVSHNCGCNYGIEYSTDSIDDPELKKKIQECKDDYLRYYVDGVPEGTVMPCPQHLAALSIFGHLQTSMEEKVNKLRGKFCSGKLRGV